MDAALVTSTSTFGMRFLVKSVRFLPIRNTATSVATLPGAFPFASIICLFIYGELIELYKFYDGHGACIRWPRPHFGDASITSRSILIHYGNFSRFLTLSAFEKSARSNSLFFPQSNKFFHVWAE